MRGTHKGYTLVELLIVLSVVATLAAMILPNFLSTRSSANEAVVVSTLRTISTAQNAFKTRVLVDRDADGEGEFGYFGEMAGLVAPRGGVPQPISPIVLGESFRIVEEGGVSKSGYLYRMSLPRQDGAPANEAATGGEDPANPSDREASEAVWVCYAWPKVLGSTGVRTFVVNEAGDILFTSNEGANQAYSGFLHAPAADAAFTEPGRITVSLAVNDQGNDEGMWYSIR